MKYLISVLISIGNPPNTCNVTYHHKLCEPAPRPTMNLNFKKGNQSKKPARKILLKWHRDLYFPRNIFPHARGKITREIQISMALNIRF